MRKILVLILLSLTCYALSAQKIIEKTFNYSGKQQVDLNLQIADSIKISTWSKNEVSVKASVSIADNRYNDDYKVEFDEAGNTVSIKAKIDSKRNNNWNGDSNCCKTDIFWEIFVPEKAPIKVETINGNIVIIGQTGEIKANSISGFIDLLIPQDLKADFKLSTITGTVYSNAIDKESMTFKKNSTDISSRYNGGGTSVFLKTISGDIYLREPGK